MFPGFRFLRSLRVKIPAPVVFASIVKIRELDWSHWVAVFALRDGSVGETMQKGTDIALAKVQRPRGKGQAALAHFDSLRILMKRVIQEPGKRVSKTKPRARKYSCRAKQNVEGIGDRENESTVSDD